MKGNILVIVFLLLLYACARRTDSNRPIAKNDSTVVVDSNSNASVLPVIKTFTYEQKEGKYFYSKYCSICHGIEGKGDGFNAFNLDPKPKDFTDKQYMQALTDDKLKEIITDGGRSVNKSSAMPAWGGRMTKQEIEYIVAYLRTFVE
jgi:cytochrome c5